MVDSAAEQSPPVRKPRLTKPKAATQNQKIEQPATVTIDLLEVVGLLNIHDARIITLEREQKVLSDAVRDIRSIQEAARVSLSSLEDNLVTHMAAMDTQMNHVVSTLTTLSTRVEDVASVAQAKDGLLSFVATLQAKEEQREKEMKERTAFLLEQAKVADERHAENVQKLSNWGPVVLVLMGNVALRNLQIPAGDQQIVAIASLVACFLYFIGTTFFSGPARKSKSILKRLKKMEDSDQ